jgi:hypothetical protein
VSHFFLNIQLNGSLVYLLHKLWEKIILLIFPLVRDRPKNVVEHNNGDKKMLLPLKCLFDKKEAS